jgi:Methionyl-tRNA formyltransferase
LLVETLKLVEEGKAPRVPQDHSKDTYAPFLPPEIAHVKFDQPAKHLRNLIRALNPDPGAFAFFRGKRVKFWRAESSRDNQLSSLEQSSLWTRTDC